MAEKQTYQSRGRNTGDRQRQYPQAADVAGRLAPRDTEVESAVLGALMLETDASSLPKHSTSPLTQKSTMPF